MHNAIRRSKDITSFELNIAMKKNTIIYGNEMKGLFWDIGLLPVQ